MSTNGQFRRIAEPAGFESLRDALSGLFLPNRLLAHSRTWTAQERAPSTPTDRLRAA